MILREALHVDPMVTLNQIAKKAGVSAATVSYVLNERDSKFGIGEETRRRVLETARELDYRPNRSARALATGRTHLIALWMPHLMSAYFARIAHLTELKLRDTPYDLLIAHLGNTPPAQVDGVLSLVDSEDSAQRSQAAHARLQARGKLPALCLMGCGVDQSRLKNADYLGVDLSDATRNAVHHLLDTGCKRIAFVTGETICSPKELRHATFTVAMKKTGRTPEYIGIKDLVNDPRGSAYEALLEYQARGDLPDGLVCLNDEIAIGAHRALRESGLRIPGDVSIIGCDGIRDTQYIEPGLSTLVQPVEEMCERAWQVLRERIENPDAPPQHIELKAQLVIRASSQRSTPAKED